MDMTKDQAAIYLGVLEGILKTIEDMDKPSIKYLKKILNAEIKNFRGQIKAKFEAAGMS